MEKEKKIPRVACFVGRIESLDDICGNDSCEVDGCMWKEGYTRNSSSLPPFENKTEGLSTGMFN